MTARKPLHHALAGGALAGLIGGLLFGLAMRELGMLTSVASLINEENVVIGFAIHILIAVLLGVIFGWFIWFQRSGAGETLYWGLAYGSFWWFIGPLTLMPFFLTGNLNWTYEAAQTQLPSLFGHLLYGIGVGLSIVWLNSEYTDETSHFSVGNLVRGMLAGLAGAAVVILLMPDHNFPVELAMGIAVLTGILYAMFDPKIEDGAGAGLIGGLVFGFFAWVIGQNTLMPLLLNEGLQWSLEAVQNNVADFVAYLLFGAGLGWSYHLLSKLARSLFSDKPHHYREEGIGAQGLKTMGWGLVSGLSGGLIFTVIMLQTGALAQIAELVDSMSPVAGFVVHMIISLAIGLTYGFFFRGRAYDLGSATGWGVSYGFFWWILGPLTLMPILLGGSPDWSAESLGQLVPSLIGHLAYGASVGIIFYIFESSQSPWWIARSRLEVEQIEFRKEQALTSAPALWTLVLLMALLLPILLV